MSYRQLRKCAVALLFVLMCNPAFAEVFRHGAVYFLGENNGGEGNWSQLKFRIQNPMVNGRKYLNRSSIEFTIDTNLENKAWYRTDIRFRSDWLSPRAYGTKFNDVYMGSKTINRSERAILAALSDPEISVLSWIITRSDELINEAVSHSNKPMPKFSSEKWLSLLRNQKFERRLRANFERIPSIKRNIGLHDRASVHSKFQLENEIQPALSTLGFYSGKIDGIWGPRTLLAIKSFERSQGFFPDGVVRNMKERNRLKSVLQASVTKASNTSALERVSIKAYSAGTLPKMEIMAIHQPNDKRPSEVQDIISVINLITKKSGSFKINGYLQRRSNYISANEICLYNDGWRQTTDNVCLSVTNPGSAYKVLSAHLSRISKAEIPYLKNKCQIIIKRYREILVASRGNDLVYRLLKAERPKFIEAANKCVELIDTFVTESGSQSEALAGSINTSNFSESKIRVRYSSIYIKTNDGRSWSAPLKDWLGIDAHFVNASLDGKKTTPIDWLIEIDANFDSIIGFLFNSADMFEMPIPSSIATFKSKSRGHQYSFKRGQSRPERDREFFDSLNINDFFTAETACVALTNEAVVYEILQKAAAQNKFDKKHTDFWKRGKNVLEIRSTANRCLRIINEVKKTRNSRIKTFDHSASKVNGTNLVAVPIDQGGPCNQSKFQVLLNQRVLKDLGLYTSVIDGVSGPKYRKAIAGGEKLLAQWVDGKKYCLSGSERKVLEAVVVAGKRGSSCKYLLSSNQIKYSFDFLRLNRVTDRSYINHKDISGLIWMIDTASELEMRLFLLKFYEETLRPTGTNTRDCRLDVAELKALTQSGSQTEALAGSIDTSQNSGPVKPASKIIEEPTCDDDPLLCPLVQLCERASYYDDGQKAWRTDISASEHVTLAKQQGVSCGVMTNTVTSAAIATCEANPSACSLAELCRTAISFKTGSLSWSTDTALQSHVEFAQNAGISCGIPKPVVASNIITPPVDPVQAVKTTTLGKYTNRKALVIGNSQYSKQTPLRNPSSDAAEIARSLEEVGFEVELALDLTRRELGRAITKFSSNAKEADISLFYFAGHGIEIDGRNYLVPIDALMDDPSALEYDVIDLQKAIDAAAGSSKLSLVMVDACRDNPFNTQVAGLNRSVSRGLKVIETDAVSKNQIVSFAAESGQVAEDGTDKNSPYAKAFSDLVVQPNLEVGKLFRQLSDSVSMLTNGRQVPVTRTRLSSEDMFFAIER